MENAETLTFGERFRDFFRYHWRSVVNVITPFIFLPLMFKTPMIEYRCLYALAIMITYWLTVSVPIYVTALLPIFMFPGLGVLSTNDTSMAYFKDPLIVFFGGLVVALTIQFSNLHSRIALGTILLIGSNPHVIQMVIMVVSMTLSMWFYNITITLIMCPIIKAILTELAAQGALKDVTEEDPDNPDKPFPSKVALSFYLGAAYAASIGGIGTLVGTGTTNLFKELYDKRFPDAGDIDFKNFMVFSLPQMLIITILTCIWLQWLFLRPNAESLPAVPELKQKIRARKDENGPWTIHEMQVLFFLIAMLVLFITRQPGFTEGWAKFFEKTPVRNSCPVMIVVVAIFLLPANYAFMRYCVCKRPAEEKAIISTVTWRFLHKEIPWGVIYLIGSGFAISDGINKCGLAALAGGVLNNIKSMPHAAIQFLMILATIVCTAFIPNIAMCSVIIPILFDFALAIEVHPGYLAVPCALALSMAFHFPYSTPGNAILYGYANVRTVDMALAGIGPTIFALLVIFLFSQTWSYVVFDQLSSFPAWVTQAPNETAATVAPA